jgi:hypothetical protein
MLIVIRLLAHHPRHCLLILHATASKDVLVTVQHIMPSRRLGRSSSSALPAIYTIWGGFRHGHGPLHNCLFARLPELCLA